MSQMRVIVRELRALLSAATVCALILGLVFTNIAQASAGPRSQSGAKTGAYALCVEHLTHQAPAERHAAPLPHENGSSGHKCPNCCLAAVLGAALLPERVAIVTSPAAAHPILVGYFAASAQEPKSDLFHAANGARAPPV